MRLSRPKEVNFYEEHENEEVKYERESKGQDGLTENALSFGAVAIPDFLNSLKPAI